MTVEELIDALGGCPPGAKVVYPEYEAAADRDGGAAANEVEKVTSLDHASRGPHVVLHDACSKFTKSGWMLEDKEVIL